MFVYKTTVNLRATDATGFLYFSELPRLGLEAFEEFLHASGMALGEILKGEYHMPIVHVEADYALPLSVSDPLEVRLDLARMGTTSFALRTAFFRREEFAGKATTVHVVVRRTTGRPMELPAALKEILQVLGAPGGSASDPELQGVEKNTSEF